MTRLPLSACVTPPPHPLLRVRARRLALHTAGGSDDAANLTTHCAFHHQRGVHAGVLRISGRAPGALVFELPLGRFRSGDRCATLRA